MFWRNEIWIGLLMGLVVPLLGFGLLYGVFALLDQEGAVSSIGLSKDFRLRTIGIVSIGLNAILMNRFQKNRATQSMRGIVIITFVYVVVWLYFFRNSISFSL
jgi:hypothetical protein